MIKPYYSDEWVTIYHLTSLPICDNISLDECMEVGLCQRKQLEGIEQGNEGKISRSYHQEHRRDTSKPRGISRNASGLGQDITHIKARISLLNLGELELYADIHSNLARDVAIQKLRDTIRMAMRETIVQRISASYAEDDICLRTVD